MDDKNTKAAERAKRPPIIHHHPGGDLYEIPCVLTLRRAAGGETRSMDVIEFAAVGEDWCSRFNWAEGNQSCNCCRALLFAQMVGEDDPNEACGDGAFVVVSLCHKDTGEVFYSEDRHDGK